MRAQLKRNYEVDGDILGTDVGEVEQAKFLGRTISVKSWGVELEADGRLVKGLLEEFDPDTKLEVETPGLKQD